MTSTLRLAAMLDGLRSPYSTHEFVIPERHNGTYFVVLKFNNVIDIGKYVVSVNVYFVWGI
jgi:hypothetical protein